MIRVRTGSRLHFGLFSLPGEHAGPWLNQEGQPTIPRRQFGGVGLMISDPGIQLTVARSKKWSAEGPLWQRALQFAHTYCDQAGIDGTFHVQVERAAREHVGLGTGTQLGLAVASAIAKLTQQPVRTNNAAHLAAQIGRGHRSAIGVHGFDKGGFLVEGGKTSGTELSPLLLRCLFSEDWEIMLIIPHGVHGVHGPREMEAFASLANAKFAQHETETLCRVVLLGMLPALQEHDLTTFGEALYDFNRRSGALFAAAQGGIYAHPRIEEIIKYLRSAGIRGVGQSSWGPTIFVVGCPDELADLRTRLFVDCSLAPEEVIVAVASTGGAGHSKS